MEPFRVLQIVDSLDAAGRQRVAVNLANLMHSNGHLSYLCTTRTEGPLQNELSGEVGRLRLDRKSSFDFNALRRLVAFNQAHDMHSLLVQYGYKQTAKDRYLSPNSTSKLAGVKVFDDGRAFNSQLESCVSRLGIKHRPEYNHCCLLASPFRVEQNTADPYRLVLDM